MKMKLKKILVAALAVTMIMGSSAVTFAAEGDGHGAGDLEIVEKTDIFKVELPTAGTTFDYILDPTGVIAETDAAKYGGKDFESGKNLYFFNREVTSSQAGEDCNYTATSNKLKVENKSTGDVTIKVNAKLTKVAEVTMAELETDLSSANEPQIFLELNGDNNKKKAITAAADGVEISDEIAATPNAYKTKYLADEDKYVKELDPTITNFQGYEFWLTGACSATTDAAKKAWKSVKQLPEVDITWTVTGDGEDEDAASNTGAPSIATKTYKATANTPIVIAVNLGKGDKAATGISSVTYTSPSGATKSVTDYTFANNKLTLSAAQATAVSQLADARVYKITFNDTASTAVDVTVSK